MDVFKDPVDLYWILVFFCSLTHYSFNMLELWKLNYFIFLKKRVFLFPLPAVCPNLDVTGDFIYCNCWKVLSRTNSCVCYLFVIYCLRVVTCVSGIHWDIIVFFLPLNKWEILFIFPQNSRGRFSSYPLFPLGIRVALLFLRESAYAQRDVSCSVLPVKQQQQPKKPHPMQGVCTNLFSELAY